VTKPKKGSQGSDILERAYEIIKNSDDGVLQSELWKMLGLDSREGSRLVMKLVKRGLVTREQVLVNGRRTYKLRAVQVSEEKIAVKINIGSILDIPCTTCPHIGECARNSFRDPATCPELDAWLEKRIRVRRSDVMRVPGGRIGGE